MAETARRPAKMRFQNLADVHARRNTEGVQYDIDGRAVLEIRHVLFRQDAGDNSLVTVAAGHFVADLKLALDRDKDFHHLDHARRKLIPALELFNLVFTRA